MTTTAPVVTPRRPDADPGSGGFESTPGRPTAADAGARERIQRLALLVLPGLWVLVVVALALTVGTRVQVAPLLAAAPAIACASTGRRQCVILGSACALFALVPLAGEPADPGQRVGTALAILAVAAASYLISQRRLRLQRDYEHVHHIADVAQQVLLRPIPERLGEVVTAVGYLSASPGARVGGDFYDVVETPFGIRAVLGDVRGCGLGALAGAAALLGAFREAACYEDSLDTVASRLDAALARHATATRAASYGEPDLRAEDFATAVLVEIAGTGRGDRPAEAGAALSIVSCGHPSPYLIGPDGSSAVPLDSDNPAPPLGLYALDASAATPRVRSLPFPPGSTLVLCTDGILDARDREGGFFPMADVLDATLAHAGGAPPRPAAVATAIRNRLVAHARGRLRDDAAVLVLGHAADLEDHPAR